MIVKKIHISLISVGDVIYHNNDARTISKENLKRGFMGYTVFGDSYRLGTIPVLKVIDCNKKTEIKLET